MTDYSQDIISILLRAPEGLSIRKIVRHVYNAHNSLFETVDLENVKRDVTQYLTYRSKTPSSPIEHTGSRGIYRLNPNNTESRQLILNFQEVTSHQDEQTETPKTENTIPDMFEGMYDD